MPGFSSLRIVPFEPEFHWEPKLDACADRINRPHEDYPKFVSATATALAARLQRPWPGPNGWPDSPALQQLHRDIFRGEKPSTWHQANVMVGQHRAPDWQRVERYMNEIHIIYAPLQPTPERIREWYVDLETIHPFLDGNGRVGGCVVALLSHHRNPDPQGRLYTPGA